MDRKLCIAECAKRTDATYRNREMTWEEISSRLSKTKRTGETMAEYLAMGKDRQGEIKDVGGFVAGYLEGGKRGSRTVKRRSMVTLDIDDGATPDLLEGLEMSAPYELIVYGTHKYNQKRPRCRIVIPLLRDVDPTEYEFLARTMADELCGIDAFDPTTFSVCRMMYWPSTPRDVEYHFFRNGGEWADPDSYIKKHPEYRDTMTWPRAKGERTEKKGTGKLTDPRTKPEPIGAFCEVYQPKEAIEMFLSDVYKEGANGRFTYSKGTSANGLRIYDSSLTVKCEDATDPANVGTSINAFDLVRIHRFGKQDDGVPEDVPINRRPSYKAMVEFAKGLPEVREELRKRAMADIGIGLFEKEKNQTEIKQKSNGRASDWTDGLTFEKRKGGSSAVEPTSDNILLILRNDPNLKGMVGNDLFKGLPMVLRESLPWKRDRAHGEWTDGDDSGLRVYLERTYRLEARQKIVDCLSIVAAENAFHPVKELVESRKWDGIERVDSLFVDYLGAEDSEYTRTVTRKLLCAAVARIYEPGAKFDYMPILVGAQGIGKSLLIKRLGWKWTQDAIPDIRTSKAYEALDGAWLVEMGELATLNKADRESIKLYLTKTEDTYRKAYARNVTVNKRTCVFVGTTNEKDFLNDSTGNRRFLPILCSGDSRLKPWEMEPEDVRQVWAEAKEMLDAGERIMELPESVSKAAAEHQDAMSYLDAWAPQIEEWLDESLPSFYFSLPTEERQKYQKATKEFRKELEAGKCEEDLKPIVRKSVCVAEVCCEWLGIPKEKIDRQTSYRVSEILKSLKSKWEYTAKAKYFGPYGRQKAFMRKGAKE